MTNALGIPRKVIILAILLPVAALLGYMLATPDSGGSMLFVALLCTVIVLPVLLGYHHPMLIFTWNFSMIIPYLPGSPDVWMLVSLVSLGFSLLAKNLNRDIQLLHVPSVTWSLLLLAVVVVATAELTGGIGLRSMGGGLYGGKKYITILFAVLGYFALSCRPIPLDKAQSYVGVFFLAGASLVIGNLLFLSDALWFLYAFFPIDYAVSQIVEDFHGVALGMTMTGRLGGVAFAAVFGFYFILMRYGIQGLLDLRKPWRMGLAVGFFFASLLGGFRSAFVLSGLILFAQFWLEGLHRTRLFPLLIILGLLGFGALIPLASKLPLSVQRSLSLLPLDINPAARADAKGTSEWRLTMWKMILPDVPRHFWLGKGYTASAADYYMAQESARRGLADPSELSRIAGDYHSGPLSVIIPFGIWGVIAFLAFLIAAGRVLYFNYRNGVPELRNINIFLFALFIGQVIFFFLVFGAVNSDMPKFCGWVGLSVALNGGVRRQKAEAETVASVPEPEPSHVWSQRAGRRVGATRQWR
jgi:hypothetical protein